MTMNILFTYETGRVGPVIDDQDQLIQELEIGIGLIYQGSTITAKETGAKIMIELMRNKIEEPANRIDAVMQAKKNVGADQITS